MEAPSLFCIIVLSLAWLGLAAIARRVVHVGRGDIPIGLAIALTWVYARLVHRLRLSGREHIPRDSTVDGRPLVIVANHTASVDPVLIQAVMTYPVRWLMAADMRIPALDPLWAFCLVIFLDRTGKADHGGMREAMRALSSGDAVGIFPEGRIRRSRRELNPFLPGVGLMVARSKAVVLPVVIRGTPLCESTWGSFWRRGRVRVIVKPTIDYQALGTKAGQISEDLRGRYVEWLAAKT